jgi:catecholate siderophore receptor
MKFVLMCGAAMALVPVAAAAEEAAAEEDQPILVTGKYQGYDAFGSVTAIKTDTPLLDIPQTINVVTREQIEDQAVRSLADVLRYVPGTTVGQGEGNRDQITLRGQNTTADFFVDGVRDDVQYFRNLYNIERVEILKGPYALIFGRGGGGGIVNRVQKAPAADALTGTLSGSVNTFGAWEASADVNVPVSETGALRVNAFHEELDNHRDAFKGRRSAINPYLAFTFGDVKAGLSYEYVDDSRVTDRGVPSLACTQPCTPGPLRGHRDTFFGTPGVNDSGLTAHIVKARVDAQLGDQVNWSTVLLYGDYDKFYTNVYANGPATAPTGTVAMAGYTDPTRRRNFIAQTSLIWDFAVAGMENKLLLGAEYGDQETRNSRNNITVVPGTINLSAFAYPAAVPGGLARSTRSDVKFVSVYAQNQISILPILDLVAGLRYDRFEIKGVDRMPEPDRHFGRTDEKISPRFGLILKPRPELSFYASYSRSFLPRSGDQFISLTPTQENLSPERFTNWEVGGKWDIKPHLSATIALFQLDRTNATTPDPANTANSINVGELRTRGIELSLTGQITGSWQVSGGYSHQDAKLRGNDFVRAGQVPRHQFALWNRYEFTDRIGLGLGVIRQSSQFAANRTSVNTTRLPGFTRVDAAIFVKASENLRVQLNVENLLDTRYFSDAHNNNNISPGAPINARLSARLKF